MKTSEYIRNYCDRWNLSNASLLTTTNTSVLYLVDRAGVKSVLKILTEVGQKDERNGATALQVFCGVGAVEIFEHDHGAQLIEYAEGESLSKLVQAGKDHQATEIVCELLNQIHFDQKEKTGKNLTTLEERFAKLFLRAEKDYRNGNKNSLFIEAAREAKELLRNQQDMVILHGDVHHENILSSKKRGWLLIDPKGLYGDRAFDALNVLFNPPGMPEVVLCEERLVRTAEALSRGLKIDLNKLWRFAFAYGCLAMVWCLEDGYPIEETESLVRVIRNKM